MKYIKIYENKLNLKKGDYVFLTNNFSLKHRCVKIIAYAITENDYHVETVLLDKNEKFLIKKINIERKLTPEEVKEIEMLINIKKYNL